MEAERRQVTVLFSDMVGFTAFSELAGEERAFRLVQDLGKLTTEAIREDGGLVHAFIGDGVMAVFGAPVAFEDAPLRACRAALKIIARLAEARDVFERKFGVPPQVRIGLNTGPAVLGQLKEVEGSAVTAAVVGDSVNVAARLQTFAQPGTVCLSESTYHLVRGQIEAEYLGERKLKGKAEPVRIFRLLGLRGDASRFAAAESRGLTAYVGRDRELEILQRWEEESRSGLRVVDIVGEPGVGKSRLAYEFSKHLREAKVFVVSGGCSSDGRQTPFSPFVEVVRAAFSLSRGEAETETARKVEGALTSLGRNSSEERDLFLNLLGLTARGNSLAGLDGLLVGLRTRDLLLALVRAQSHVSRLAIIIEDLQWIDSASEELLGNIVAAERSLAAFVLLTHRPEYVPPWASHAAVRLLRLEPLSPESMRQIVRHRVGFARIPEALEKAVSERAEGNALFAEEIVSFLTARRLLRVAEDKIEFDEKAVARAVPSSLQGLLMARVDQLAQGERALLQAASVIGRRFDADLLSAAIGDRAEVAATLARIGVFDLVRPLASEGEYEFKHALVRDALYQSLLTERRASLHLTIAEEIERRWGNRQNEAAQALAHHFSHTNRADKTFTYLSMAGAKSLGVYAFEEAGGFFGPAAELLEKHPHCASDDQLADFLVDFLKYCALSMQIRLGITVHERFLKRLAFVNPRIAIIVHHYYVLLLLHLGRLRDADKVKTELSALLEKTTDPRARVYALITRLSVETCIDPPPLEVFEELCRCALGELSAVNDTYLQCTVRLAVGWGDFHRGRLSRAYAIAQELISVGKTMNDPRATGMGLMLQGCAAVANADYDAAYEFACSSIALARTNFDAFTARSVRTMALVLLRRPDGASALQDFLSECDKSGSELTAVVVKLTWGVAMALQGDLRGGMRATEQAIEYAERIGYVAPAEWGRLNLAELYLEVIAAKERPSLAVLLKNLPTIINIYLTAEARITSLVKKVRQNEWLDPSGQPIGRCEMILGLMYKAKKKRLLAIQHLREARRISAQFGSTPILARVDAALRELSAPG